MIDCSKGIRGPVREWLVVELVKESACSFPLTGSPYEGNGERPDFGGQQRNTNS